MMGVHFAKVVSCVSEETQGIEDPAEHVRVLSRRKAEEAARGLSSGLVIGADTVVEIDGDILQKPKDEEDAVRMLLRLEGRTHRVFTGITLVDSETGAGLTDVVCTRVTMRSAPEVEIREYVSTGEPMDKAGAYAAQGLAACFIERVEGCFFNVVGLPLARLWQMLEQMSCNLWEMRRDGAAARGAS